jgi:hypothetical protein
MRLGVSTLKAPDCQAVVTVAALTVSVPKPAVVAATVIAIAKIEITR